MEADPKTRSKLPVFAGIVFTVVFVYGYVTLYLKKGEVYHSPLPKTFVIPLTIHTNNGRLGNQMFTFATLYGLSQLNKRKIVLMKHNHDVLIKYFDINYPSVLPEFYPQVKPWKIGNWLKDEDKKIPLKSNIIKGTLYPTSYTFFHHCRQDIRRVFSFNDEYRNHAQQILWEVKKDRPWTQVFVGIHVRRGDYLKHSRGGWLRAFDGREVDDEFFELAIRHFTDKYNNVTFLAVSDDREWCRQNLTHHGIITTPESPSAGHDLALLSQCNHTIMTYGTYGFWGGYLAGGEVVYFADFLKPNTSFTKEYFVYDKMYPEDWVGISTTKPGFWESYTNPYLT